MVQPSGLFERQGDDLVKTIDISALDAILGIEQVITTIDHKSLNVTIPAGTQPNTTLALQGQGMPNMHDNRFRGRLLLKINITIPTDLTDAQKEFIRSARA
jgi:molecular chaperone DnaJ